jgi:hypothetical protein
LRIDLAPIHAPFERLIQSHIVGTRHCLNPLAREIARQYIARGGVAILETKPTSYEYSHSIQGVPCRAARKHALLPLRSTIFPRYRPPARERKIFIHDMSAGADHELIAAKDAGLAGATGFRS